MATPTILNPHAAELARTYAARCIEAIDYWQRTERQDPTIPEFLRSSPAEALESVAYNARCLHKHAAAALQPPPAPDRHEYA